MRLPRSASVALALIVFGSAVGATPELSAAPANDACSGGSVVPSAPFTDATVTTDATTELTDPPPSCGNGSQARSIWYRFTAPASGGSLTADTLGSDYDTILSAWSGACGQLSAWPGGCNDDFGSAQSRIDIVLAGGQTVYLMVTAFFGDGGSLVFHVSFSPASGDTSGLTLGKAGNGVVALSWSSSCQPTDTDYEIYQGTLGSWSSDVPAVCTTAGATTATLTPSASSAYFLVVPRNGSREGSYGTEGAGAERPPSLAACLGQSLAGCPPACVHGKCATGGELNPACDVCAAQVCAVDPFCCHIGWDGTCVTEVRSVCSSVACPDSSGTCAHGLCQIGASLTAQCDDPPVDPSCVTEVCTADSFCCTNLWDAACVAEVPNVCAVNCN
jgi:hypothetical protein